MIARYHHVHIEMLGLTTGTRHLFASELKETYGYDPMTQIEDGLLTVTSL